MSSIFKTYSDNHLHYTGSLPLPYVWEKIKVSGSSFTDNFNAQDLFSVEVIDKIRHGDCSERVFNLFKTNLGRIFNLSAEYEVNYQNFFKLYSIFQDLTKPKTKSDTKIQYYEGTKAIISNLVDQKVKKFDIFAGPLLDQKTTELRILGMIQAFEDMKNLPIKGTIRLTFISKNEDGNHDYANLTPESFKKLSNFIITNRDVYKYISGFDFSGNEHPRNLDLISSTVNYVSKINDSNHKYKRKLKISVHAGENIIGISPEKYLEYFDRLLDLPINSIGHGVFLWAPNELFDYSENVNKHRLQLLKKVASRNVGLEICPTSNVLFTPLKSYSQIPLRNFEGLGLKYSINTDSMTMLSTNLITEYKRVNC